MERRDKGEATIVQGRLIVRAWSGGRYGEKQATWCVSQEVHRGDTEQTRTDEGLLDKSN